MPLLKKLCPIADVYALARFSRQKDIDKISALGAKIIRKDLATDSLTRISLMILIMCCILPS
jgi:hypothetical protein